MMQPADSPRFHERPGDQPMPPASRETEVAEAKRRLLEASEGRPHPQPYRPRPGKGANMFKLAGGALLVGMVIGRLGLVKKLLGLAATVGLWFLTRKAQYLASRWAVRRVRR